MLALTINSTCYRNLRGGAGHDVAAKDLARRCDSAGIGHRGQNGQWKPARLLSGSLFAGMSGAGLRTHEIVEGCRAQSRINPIAARRSGRMVSSLPSIGLAIRVAIAFSLTLLSLVLIFSRSSARYPHFATLIYFTTCG